MSADTINTRTGPVTLHFFDQAYVTEQVQNFLSTFFEENIDRAQTTLSSDYAELWKVMADVTLAGGKRLRPFLCMYSYGAFKGQNFEAVLPIAAALELLHQCLLIHDDVIDRDYIRHGQKNVAGRMQDIYQTLHPETEHYADSAAILAGDLMLSSCYQIIQMSTIDAELKQKIIPLIGDAVFSVGGGELIDTISVLKPLQSADPIAIAKHKTSSYSFVAPLLSGALLAEASQAQLIALKAIGENLGIAYQLRDDLLGVFGQQEQTGKSTLSDIREAKRTYLMQQGMLLATDTQQAVLQRALGNTELTDAEARDVMGILELSGAKGATEKLINGYVSTCEDLLGRLRLEASAMQVFSTLIENASTRIV